MTKPPLLPPALAQVIDYTDLRKDLTYGDVEALCLEALVHGIGTIVVPSMLVPRAVACVGAGPVVSCVIGYPFGTQAASVKATEASNAVAGGARQLEVVPHFGALRAGRWQTVADELRAIREASNGATLTLVLETRALDRASVERACALAADLNYTLVANSIGFRTVSTRPETQGAATPEAIEALIRLAGKRIGVKAIGGISTRAEVEALLRAGAARVALEARHGLLRRFADEEAFA